MNNEELLNKIKKIKTNLEYARKELNNSNKILCESINFNNQSFKSDDVYNINNKLDKQIEIINKKILNGAFQTNTNTSIKNTTSKSTENKATTVAKSNPKKINKNVQAR